MFMTPPQILTTQQQKEPAKQEKINTTKHGFHMIKKLEKYPNECSNLLVEVFDEISRH